MSTVENRRPTTGILFSPLVVVGRFKSSFWCQTRLFFLCIYHDILRCFFTLLSRAGGSLRVEGRWLFEVQMVDAMELLRLASAYGLHFLAEAIESATGRCERKTVQKDGKKVLCKGRLLEKKDAKRW